jgi:hypothetical protein
LAVQVSESVLILPLRAAAFLNHLLMIGIDETGESSLDILQHAHLLHCGLAPTFRQVMTSLLDVVETRTNPRAPLLQSTLLGALPRLTIIKLPLNSAHLPRQIFMLRNICISHWHRYLFPDFFLQRVGSGIF